MATKGTVSGVIANMVTLTVDGPVAQNEICYILTGGDRLMAEVIKVVGSNVYVQVFESTRGLKVGAEAEFTGHMLEVTLGPGMLSKNYDGLQNDLDKMDGVFLKRGQYTYPLDKERKWHFVPLVKVGDEVGSSAWLGQVDENFQPLKIMVPFQLDGTYKVKSIVKEGEYGIEDTVVVLTDKDGKDIPVNMIQKWPVKKAMTNYKEKPRPYKLLETGVRVIDTVNPCRTVDERDCAIIYCIHHCKVFTDESRFLPDGAGVQYRRDCPDDYVPAGTAACIGKGGE